MPVVVSMPGKSILFINQSVFIFESLVFRLQKNTGMGL